MIEAYFAPYNILQPEEIAHLARLFRPKKLAKMDFFAQPGKPCREVALVVSGIFRSFYTNAEGQEMTYCITFPHHLMAAYSALITGMVNQENIQALSPAELLVVNKEELDRLAMQNIRWMSLLRAIAEQHYLELERRLFQLQRDSAAQRYRDLLEHQPEYVRHIPLQYLASYLGITQRHLSRIRRGAAK
jgi:CRP-like cAMP-binding protein